MLPNRLFFDDMFEFKPEDKMMKCDIYEEDGKYVLEASIPGFNKEDVKIECEDGNIIISAERKADEVSNNKKYLRRERHFHGKCERRFYLGEIDEENIKASFNNGILKVIAPKKELEKSKRFIDID